MNFQRVGIILTAVNLGLLIFVLVVVAQIRVTVVAHEVAPVLRGRALEIVDERGRVRASLNVYPPNTQKNRESSETVLLRLITERGRPSVKISASEQLAAIVLAGRSGTKETYVQLGAKGTVSSLRLKNEDGRELLFNP
jgi:hypothetical protein